MEESNGAQSAGDERRRRRKPATGFPVLDLGKAASMLARASQHGWEHTVAEIAGYMGHATTNSGAFRAKLAALRDYGLVSVGVSPWRSLRSGGGSPFQRPRKSDWQHCRRPSRTRRSARCTRSRSRGHRSRLTASDGEP